MNLESIDARLKDYHTLDSTLGCWIKDQASSKRQVTHFLIICFKEYGDDDILFLRHLEDNLESYFNILKKDKYFIEKYQNILTRLKDKDLFFDVLAEIEWIAYLDNKKFCIDIEPHFPRIGPDVIASMNDNRKISFEITCLYKSESNNKVDTVYREVASRLKKIYSKFILDMSINDNFTQNNIIPLLRLLELKLKEYNKLDQPVTLYYYGDSKSREWIGFDGVTLPDDIHSNIKKYPLYYKQGSPMAEIHFLVRLDKKIGKTLVYHMPEIREGESKRIRKKLGKKLKQISRDIPGIIVMFYSLYITQNSFQDTLFGDEQVTLYFYKKSNRYLALRWDRANNALFKKSRRISAVIFVKRYGDQEYHLATTYYPNDNCINPLKEDEIKSLQ